VYAYLYIICFIFTFIGIYIVCFLFVRLRRVGLLVTVAYNILSIPDCL